MGNRQRLHIFYPDQLSLAKTGNFYLLNFKALGDVMLPKHDYRKSVIVMS